MYFEQTTLTCLHLALLNLLHYTLFGQPGLFNFYLKQKQWFSGALLKTPPLFPSMEEFAYIFRNK